MIESQIEAIIIKVASIGLKEYHLGMTIKEVIELEIIRVISFEGS